LSAVQLIPVPDFPIISEPVDLGLVVERCLRQAFLPLADGDVLVVAQKVVSKAEGRLVRLRDVVPSERACEVAAQCGKDPRLVEVILQESAEVVRAESSHLITRHRIGYVSANAAVDRSNVLPASSAAADEDGQDEWACLLPLDPVASARRLMDHFRQAFGANIGVVISDSHGRPFRLGAIGVSLAAAGFEPLRDYRGTPDLFGRQLQTSTQAVADEIASAASLLMGQGREARPLVIVRGVELQVIDGVSRHATLVRPKEHDLFR